MDVALPDGQSATFRDVLMRGDIREARRGMVFITAPDGSRRTDGALLDDLTGRVITRMLVSWTLPLPRPGEAQGEHNAQRILDQLDEHQSAALEAAVQPWVNRILSMSKVSYSFTHDATGETIEVTEQEQAQRLAASGHFTALEAPGPKSGQKSIGTTSAAEQDGPTTTE